MCLDCLRKTAVLDQLEAGLIEWRVRAQVAEAKVEVYEDHLEDTIEELREARDRISFIPGL